MIALHVRGAFHPARISTSRVLILVVVAALHIAGLWLLLLHLRESPIGQVKQLRRVQVVLLPLPPLHTDGSAVSRQSGPTSRTVLRAAAAPISRLPVHRPRLGLQRPAVETQQGRGQAASPASPESEAGSTEQAVSPAGVAGSTEQASGHPIRLDSDVIRQAEASSRSSLSRMIAEGDPTAIRSTKSRGQQLTSSVGQAVKPDCLHPGDEKDQGASLSGLLALPALAKAALAGECR